MRSAVPVGTMDRLPGPHYADLAVHACMVGDGAKRQGSHDGLLPTHRRQAARSFVGT